jgi:hypothetical protein
MNDIFKICINSYPEKSPEKKKSVAYPVLLPETWLTENCDYRLETRPLLDMTSNTTKVGKEFAR